MSTAVLRPTAVAAGVIASEWELVLDSSPGPGKEPLFLWLQLARRRSSGGRSYHVRQYLSCGKPELGEQINGCAAWFSARRVGAQELCGSWRDWMADLCFA